MIEPELLDHERRQFFIQTQGSVYLPLIGIIFWPSLAVAGYFLSPRIVCLSVFFILVLLLPIALIAGQWLSKKLLLKSPLASLIAPALVPIAMSFGITIPLYFTNITLVPLAFVLGLSLHWPAFGWLYKQPSFTIHCLARTVLAVTIWYFYPEDLFTLLPISVGLLYLATACWLLLELHQAKTNPDSTP
jgi:hypothetical protein